jgi:hypothetical protein
MNIFVFGQTIALLFETSFSLIKIGIFVPKKKTQQTYAVAQQKRFVLRIRESLLAV